MPVQRDGIDDRLTGAGADCRFIFSAEFCQRLCVGHGGDIVVRVKKDIRAGLRVLRDGVCRGRLIRDAIDKGDVPLRMLRGKPVAA